MIQKIILKHEHIINGINNNTSNHIKVEELFIAYCF